MRRPSVRRATIVLAALGLVLSACEADPAPTLHELTVTGALERRVAWLYGEPRSFTIDGTERTLTAAPGGPTTEPWYVPAALWIDGEPALVEHDAPTVTPPVTVRRIPLTTDVQMRTARETRAVLYFDGSVWLTLGEFDPAGLDVRVTPRPRFGALRGLGELTNAEADVLARNLEALAQPLIVSVLTGDEVPRRAVDGVAESRATAVHVVAGVPVDVGSFRPPARDVPFEVVARGQQAVGITAPTYQLLRNREEFSTAWNRAHGAALEAPPLPGVDFDRETLLAVFLGPKPTGGYGADVRAVTLEGGDLFIDLVESAPGPGTMVTQALTSPWLLVRVPRGGVSAAWFRDPIDGRLIAVARRSD
jgi:hypothetical protein